MNIPKPCSSTAKYRYGAVIEEDGNQLYSHNVKHKLKRSLSTFATFGIAFTSIGTLSSISATFQAVLQRGGPVTMLLNWNIVAGLMICVILSFAEICSLYPASGGLYYWVFELLQGQTRNNKKTTFIVFLTGWIYTIAVIISIGVTNVTVAMSMGSIAKIAFRVEFDKMMLTFITIAVTLIHGLFNVCDLRGLAVLNKLSVFWSCAGLVGVISVLSLSAKHQDLSWVLTDYENQTGFDSQTYVFILGMIGAAYSFIGCESIASVNEETKEADLSSPIAMVMSFAVCWFIGLVFLISLLFSIQDIDAILSSPLDMPVAQLFWDAVGPWGSISFLTLILVCQFCTGATTMTVASRQVYALARDGAVPLSTHLSKLNHRQLPAAAVGCTVALACIVVSPYPLSEHMFETIVSASTITTHLAYAIVLGCRLLSPLPSRKGRFSLGRWTVPVTCIGFVWTVFAVGAFMLPTTWPIQADDTNYSGLSLLLVVMMTCLFWHGWGRHNYTGPRVFVEDGT